jgi:hypothetical protein
MEIATTKEASMKTATGLSIVKTVIGYAAHARIQSELVDAGYVRRMPIRTPYSWTPAHRVYEYRGRYVIVAETAHCTYKLIAVPSSFSIRNTDAEATKDFVIAGGLPAHQAALEEVR